MSKTVLDIQTSREVGMAAPVVAFCILTSMLVIAWVLQPESQLFLVVGGVGLLSCLASFIAWRMLSEYMEINEAGGLEFVREFAGSTTRKPLGSPTEVIESVVVQTWITRHAGLRSLALLGRDGKVMALQHYRLPDQEKVPMPISSYDALLRHGQELAEKIGVPFEHGAKGEHLTVKKIDGKFQAVYSKESPLRPLLLVTALMIVLLPLAYFAIHRYTQPY